MQPEERDITWTLVGLTLGEMEELILLIDDDPVDEEALSGIRKKLAAKRRRLIKKARARA